VSDSPQASLPSQQKNYVQAWAANRQQRFGWAVLWKGRYDCCYGV